jgi:hypothetical protein
MKRKCLAVGIILFLIGISITPIVSSIQTKTNGPEFSISNMKIKITSQYLSPPFQLLIIDVKYNGDSLTTRVHYKGEAIHYPLFEEPYLVGTCNTGILYPPSHYWQPNEIRTLETIPFYNNDKPFLQLFFPCIYHLWFNIGTNWDENPENTIIDGYFLIWGPIIRPI